MHSTQQKLLALLRDQGAIPMKYREIGRRIGEKYPQTVKHHIESLKKDGLIVEQNGNIRLNQTDTKHTQYLNLPFYGLANCGEATCLAEDRAQGFIKISRNVLPNKAIKNIFLLRASGNSMNNAEIGHLKQNINDGDFVVVDSSQKDPKDKDYIVSVIDGSANIKKFRYSAELNQVQLLSESTDEYLPIILHASDDFCVIGKVIAVIKNFNNPHFQVSLA